MPLLPTMSAPACRSTREAKAASISFGAGLQDIELRAVRARRLLQISHHALSLRTLRVHQQGDHPGQRDQLGKQFEPLGVQLDDENADAREVFRRERLATRPSSTGSPLTKVIGIVPSRASERAFVPTRYIR